jgi:coproporphyrinogen III oxidase
MAETQPNSFEIREKMKTFVFRLQDEICEAVEQVESETFIEDEWERDGGGGGVSRVIQDGDVLHKAGVNVSVVSGELSEEAAREMGGGTHIDDLSFWAAGLSLVFHPVNPMAPTVHANYRYFERGDGNIDGGWWFGGGSDLTPAYLFEEDARHFHSTLKSTCDEHDPEYYPEFKEWCDEYFYIPHREEHRGVGGIFFDNLHDGERDELFDFVRDCGDALIPSYMPILERRKDMDYSDSHKRWQRLRRGRYVEFNLVYDRGTKFGLRTGGRTESILMSLPLEARWEYDPDIQTPAQNDIMDVLVEPRDWVCDRESGVGSEE